MRAVDAVVRRREPIAGAVAPGLDDAVDRARVELRARPRGRSPRRRRPRECPQAAAQRRAGPALPLGAVDDARVGLDARARRRRRRRRRPSSRRSASSTAGRNSRCFGEPKRVAAPAASTTAATTSRPSTFEMTTARVGCSSPRRRACRSGRRRRARSVTLPTTAYSGGSEASSPVTTKNWLPAVPAGSAPAFAIATTPCTYDASAAPCRASSTRARPCPCPSVAALDHEARDDPMEERVVEEAALRERDERAGRVRRRLLVERHREVAAVRLEDEAVRLRRRRASGARPRACGRRASVAVASAQPPCDALVSVVVLPPPPPQAGEQASAEDEGWCEPLHGGDASGENRSWTRSDPVREERRRQHRLPGDRRRAVRPRARSRVLLASRARLGASGVAPHHRAAVVVRAADQVRQARHRAFRPVGRAARLRGADGRRAGGDGRGRQRARRAVRLLGGRADVRPLRGDVPGTHARARALRNVREAACARDDYPWAPTWEERVADAERARASTGARGSTSSAMAPNAPPDLVEWMGGRGPRRPQPARRARPDPHELEGRRSRRAARSCRRRRSCCTAPATATRTSRRAATSPSAFPARSSSSSPGDDHIPFVRPRPDPRRGRGVPHRRAARAGRRARARDGALHRPRRIDGAVRASSAIARWAELLERHHDVVRRELARFGGEEIDTAGDGFLALAKGRRARSAARSRSATPSRALGLSVRAGVHTGEVERPRGGTPRGIAVHVGARVAARGRRERGARLLDDERSRRRLGHRASRTAASSS